MPTEPPHNKTNKLICAPSEDSDQPGHPPSLIRVFAVRMKKALVLSYPLRALRRLGSDWADAQADESSLGAVIFVGFVMRWLNSFLQEMKREINRRLDRVPELQFEPKLLNPTMEQVARSGN